MHFGFWILDFGLRASALLRSENYSSKRALLRHRGKSKIQNPKSKFTFLILILIALSVHAAPAFPAEPLTFNRDIAPIIFINCSACHRPDQMGPFALLTFNDVKKRAAQIAKVTADHYMPPWLPGHDCCNFIGERRLSNEQIAMIQQWVAQGMTEGDAHDLPAPPKFDDPPDGWRLGPPDLVLTIEQPYSLAATGDDVVRSFVLPVNLPADRFVKAIEFHPGNQRVVHHASFLIDVTGSARMLDEADPGPGYQSTGDIGLNLAGSFGGWSRGGDAALLPEGVGRPMPKTCDLVVEMHLNPSGKPEAVQPTVGLYFAKEPIDRPMMTISLGSFFIDIAPDDKAYTVSDSFTLPVDVQIVGLTPRAHYVCRHMTAEAALPDGTTIPLLQIKDWDFNWQQEYRFAQPVHLPAGSQMRMRFIYDNSADNPRNPSDPPKRIRAGEKASDEMALLLADVIPDVASNLPTLEQANHEKLIERMNVASAKRGK